jgi:hypothetical protein
MTAFNVNHSFKFIGFFYSCNAAFLPPTYNQGVKVSFIKEISPLLAFDNSLTKARLVLIFLH